MLQEKDIAGDPLYRRIQAVLRERIVSGQWAAGATLPSRRLLCAEFGTSRVTLDKAIQGLVSEGILSATAGSGTYVAAPSTASAIEWSLRVGVISGRGVMDGGTEETIEDNFYFGPLFQGIRDGFTGQPVQITYDYLPSRDYHRFCQDKGLNGVVLVTPTLDALSSLHALTSAGIPYVAVGITSNSPGDAGLCTVDTDNQQGAADAVRLLLNLGHRRIALVNLAMSHANHHDRLEGYCRTLAAAGLAVAPEDLVLLPNYMRAHFEERVEAWLTRAFSSGSMPTAVFACDYMMSLATLRVLRRHGLQVPGDVSVIGFDDPISAAHLTPPLTTVRQPVYRLGRRAAERLLTALQEGVAPQGPELLPTELIVRESTCPPKAAIIKEREVIRS